MGEPPASCWVLLQLRSCARAVVQCALLHVSKMTATLWRVYFCAKDCIHFSLQPLFAAWCEAWLCGWQSPAGIEHREVICSTDMRWQSQPSSAKRKHATQAARWVLFREMPSRTWRTIEFQLFSWAVATHNNKCVSDATNVGGCAHAYTTALGPWNSTIILLSWNCCFFWILSCARIERRHLFCFRVASLQPHIRWCS